MSKPARIMTLRIDEETDRRLQEWIAAQDVPPPVSNVVRAAINAWLDAREEPQPAARKDGKTRSKGR